MMLSNHLSVFYLLAILFFRSHLNVSITPSGAGHINASSLVIMRFWRFSARLVAVSSAFSRFACLPYILLSFLLLLDHASSYLVCS
jgi:hypothetical protein